MKNLVIGETVVEIRDKKEGPLYQGIFQGFANHGNGVIVLAQYDEKEWGCAVVSLDEAVFLEGE